MALNNKFSFSGAVAPSSIEQNVHEEDMLALRTISLPSNQQVMIDYDVNNNPIYLGVAPSGFSTTSGTDNDNSKSNWMIQKINWTGSNCTSIQIGWGRWSNRTALTYA